MNLTKEQGQAKDAVLDWIKAGPRSDWRFTLKGWAGTGKTTLIQDIINSLEEPPLCCAPTGKAASVLGAKLRGVKVSTIHSLLYRPNQKDNTKDLEELMNQLSRDPENSKIQAAIKEERERLAQEDIQFTKKSNEEVDAGGLIVVDEASMVPEPMLKDFQTFGAKVLFVGDDGQLPPVKGAGEWFFGQEDFRLMTVMRQAEDNPIIRLATEVRQGNLNRLRYNFNFDNCRFIDGQDIDHNSWLGADQVLSGTNAARQKFNRFIRSKLGYADKSTLPVEGEKLIALKNDYSADPMLINGVFCKCTSDAMAEDGMEEGVISFEYEGAEFEDAQWYPYHCAHNYDQSLTETPRNWRDGLVELDYGYCVTVHKAQGSEWDDVILIDKGEPFSRQGEQARRRWLYTGVTRAKESLTIAL